MGGNEEIINCVTSHMALRRTQFLPGSMETSPYIQIPGVACTREGVCAHLFVLYVSK